MTSVDDDPDLPLTTVGNRNVGTRGSINPLERLKFADLSVEVIEAVNNLISVSAEKQLPVITSNVKQLVRRLRPFDSKTQALCFKPLTDLGDAAEVRCEEMILKLIEYTSDTLDVMAYDLTNKVIVSHIIAKIIQHKIKVRIIADNRNFSLSQGRGINLLALRNVGAQVYIDCKPNSEHHNKLMIFDNLVTFTGSYNFSKHAEDQNSENIRVSTKNVQEVSLYFEKRLEQVVPYEIFNKKFPTNCVPASKVVKSKNSNQKPDKPWDWTKKLT